MTTLPNSKVRQAVVIVHGMGEQRPLETLNQFTTAAIAPGQRGPAFYSRPDLLLGRSFESRVYHAPAVVEGAASDAGQTELRAETDFYEYHWAHLMQGNRIDDLWPVFRRMMVRFVHRVPSSLRVVWLLFWAAVVLGFSFLLSSDVSIDVANVTVDDLVLAVAGTGFLGAILTFVITRAGPGWITSSFVDVVRYLDTSPRSYAVRREIRKGMVELLDDLHKCDRYQRIIVVAHSLGAFIAYDGISFLWTRKHGIRTPGSSARRPSGLADVEKLASNLADERWHCSARKNQCPTSQKETLDQFQVAQRRLWQGLRAQGNPWLITDFITFGTPMYFADRLATKNLSKFRERVERWELPTCPPQSAPRSGVENGSRRFSSDEEDDRFLLYHAAPFAVVRWTNLWFPARFGFFGDWFGHALAPLFGNGIRDVPLKGNLLWRWIPGYAHALYFQFPHKTGSGTATSQLRKYLGLDASSWLERTLGAPKVSPPS